MNTRLLIVVGIYVFLLLGIFLVYEVRANELQKVSEKQGGEVCTMDYNPVCGVNGITYGNECMAGETLIAYVGECIEGTFLAGEEIPQMSDEELASS